MVDETKGMFDVLSYWLREFDHYEPDEKLIKQTCEKTGMTLEQVTEAADQVTKFMAAVVEAQMLHDYPEETEYSLM
jgi:hypothetical protein